MIYAVTISVEAAEHTGNRADSGENCVADLNKIFRAVTRRNGIERGIKKADRLTSRHAEMAARKLFKCQRGSRIKVFFADVAPEIGK